MNWTKQEEELAKKEYLSMIDALKASEEFENEWIGEWEDFEKKSFGKKSSKIKGDKHKYMKYWLEDQSLINDTNWNKFEEEEQDEHI
jgi:hypothetical protein